MGRRIAGSGNPLPGLSQQLAESLATAEPIAPTPARAAVATVTLTPETATLRTLEANAQHLANGGEP